MEMSIHLKELITRIVQVHETTPISSPILLVQDIQSSLLSYTLQADTKPWSFGGVLDMHWGESSVCASGTKWRFIFEVQDVKERRQHVI